MAAVTSLSLSFCLSRSRINMQAENDALFIVFQDGQSGGERRIWFAGSWFVGRGEITGDHRPKKTRELDYNPRLHFSKGGVRVGID